MDRVDEILMPTLFQMAKATLVVYKIKKKIYRQAKSLYNFSLLHLENGHPFLKEVKSFVDKIKIIPIKNLWEHPEIISEVIIKYEYLKNKMEKILDEK